MEKSLAVYPLASVAQVESVAEPAVPELPAAEISAAYTEDKNLHRTAAGHMASEDTYYSDTELASSFTSSKTFSIA